jgi:hypothetical protein
MPEKSPLSLARPLVLAIGILAVVAVGCAGRPATSPAAVSTAPASAAVASVSPTASIPSHGLTLRECADGEHCDVAPGSYVTGPYGFFPGLEITIPANWYFTEQDSGELALRQDDDHGLLLWKDVRVVATNRSMGPMNMIMEDVAGTPEAFVEWFTTNDQFTVIEEPQPAAIAGTTGTVFAIQVSESADYGDPGCPDNPRCADFVTDPAHWGGNFYSTGAVVRLYMATVTYPAGNHLFVVVWEAPNPAELLTFAEGAQPIVDSIRLPGDYISN